jgi:lysophospholipase L1-like esterase
MSRAAAVLLSLLPVVFAQDFFLKDKDRVVFYGDSITDQRLYTTFVETFALSRFPDRQITFTHSGWGGDRVTGGGGGGVQVRLTRDVIAYKPTVVTIMLGMNDGRYRAFDQQIFDIYANGYKNIVKTLKSGAPGVRITGIIPSPYDDVTRAPNFPGGYNEVLLRYGKFIQDLAGTEALTVADLNTEVVAMLKKANAGDAENARKILPDRVHPGASGHLIMAASLLKAWKAPAVVSEFVIDAVSRSVASEVNTKIDDLERDGRGVKWTQTDKALPVAIDLTDPVMALAVNSSDFMDTLNRQIFQVRGAPAGRYTLRIDGSEVATFSADELNAGVNLARYRTPMWAQAWQLHQMTLKRAALHNTRWRQVEVPLEKDAIGGTKAALDALDQVEAELTSRQRALAQPKPHQFELRVADSDFKAVFNGTDLSGWHISQVNHHGKTQGWKVEDGAITGTQDKPGHGGILLTDKKYKNFEVQMELRPDYGCDSGLFLRASEKGEAYQVLLDYLDGGSLAGIYGERLKDVKGFQANWEPVWKRTDWNHIRARIEGDVPHIQVWLNGVKVTDWTDTANHLPDGATEGMVAVQVHAGNRWIPGAKHRFRNISIRELP